MAPTSPRRSSRARPTNSQSQQSSISSGASIRAERNTRSVNKTPSGKSTPSASLSSEPPEDLDDTLLSRRRKRGQDDDADLNSRSEHLDTIEAVEDLQDEEDEAVRCICGSDEYPGPPPETAPDAEYFLAHELTEDVTGFFVQCDICKVWQHGACVGIFSAESSPDEYFCDLCRQDFHKIHTAATGQRYSRYLPTSREARASSRSSINSKNDAQSPTTGNTKLTRQESASLAAKRRSTMNSRDAAYDDEQLRRAIEASKENKSESADGLRRPKRGRSDSEEHPPNAKRQRTNSASVTPPVDIPEISYKTESGDEAEIHEGSKVTRQSRSSKDNSEKDEKEKQRAEAASKRKGRAERRRAEGESSHSESPTSQLVAVKDPDGSEEASVVAVKALTMKTTEPLAEPETPTPPEPTPDTPPATAVNVGGSSKRTARTTQRKGKGKNQYTRDRETEPEGSPARSLSKDTTQKLVEEATSLNVTKPATVDVKSGSKAKAAVPTKMTMLDMKRRVGAIMDFISRTQVDLAAEATPSQSSSGQQSPQKGDGKVELTEKGGANAGPSIDIDSIMATDQDFKDLNCVEMMDVLTRDMVKWQNLYTR